jgi:hypothetical protein
MLAYSYLYDKIPDKDKYDLFVMAYKSTDFYFQSVREDVDVDYLLTLNRLNDRQIDVLSFGYMFHGGRINIYRAQGSKSCPLENAISWTTDIEVAKRFARIHNLEGDGIIYQATVWLENITDYITDRNESEILVDYKHLSNIRRIPNEYTKTIRV